MGIEKFGLELGIGIGDLDWGLAWGIRDLHRGLGLGMGISIGDWDWTLGLEIGIWGWEFGLEIWILGIWVEIGI